LSAWAGVPAKSASTAPSAVSDSADLVVNFNIAILPLFRPPGWRACGHFTGEAGRRQAPARDA